MNYILAVHVRKIDPPQYVAETFEELAELAGELAGFEQCDACGNSAYRITVDGDARSFSAYATCTTDPDRDADAPESERFSGCGRLYPIYWERVSKTAGVPAYLGTLEGPDLD